VNDLKIRGVNKSANRQAKGAVADYMNSLPKVVCSRTLEAASWNNSTLLKDRVAEEMASLKQQGDGDMFVFGSANLSKTLMNERLFDEYRIGIAPVIHGRGRLLFEGGLKRQGLRLLESRSLSSGCVILRYRPEGFATDGDAVSGGPDEVR
jgi:dihydrofolate reductase